MRLKKTILSLLGSLLVVFTLQAQDLQITTMPTVNSGCNLSNCNPITVTIYNNGPTGIFVTPTTVSYVVNGGSPVTEAFSLTLPVGGVYIYTFFACADLSMQGNYTIVADVNLSTETNPANDALSVTIVNDTTVVGGTLTGSDTVCSGFNSGIITLSGNTGTIDYWESSTDGGLTWDSIPNTNSFYNYSGLTASTMYHVHLDGGYCPDGFSPTVAIVVDDTTDAGVLTGSTTVCSTGNSGTLNLTAYVGSILYWEYSTDGGTVWSPITNTTPTHTFTNLTTTTIFRVAVQSGVCNPAASTYATVTVTDPPIPGSVTTNATVCSGNNSDTLYLIGYTGTVSNWISSTDGGVTYNGILNSNFFQSYNNLTQTTMYCAIVASGVCANDTSMCATITVSPIPVANAGSDTTISLGDTACFSASGGVFYDWTPAATLAGSNTANPCVFGASTVGSFTYTVTVYDATGCTDTDDLILTVLDTVTVPVYGTPTVVISNFITPNGDGDNDVWNIFDAITGFSIDFFYPLIEVTVANNHGQVLLNKSGYLSDWQAEGLTDGSYYYIVKIPELDKTFKGILTVLDSK